MSTVKNFDINNSIYQVWRDNNLKTLKNGANTALDYFGKITTFAEADKLIDAYARSFQALLEDPNSTVTFCTATLPSTLLGFFALNKLGVRVNFVAEPVLQSDGKTYLDDTDSQVLVVLDSFYANLAPAIAQTNVKDIVIVSLLDDAGDPLEVAKRVQQITPPLKDIPTEQVVNILRGAYGTILESGKIPGKNYYNLAEFLEKGKAAGNTKVESRYTPDATAVILYTGGSTGKPKGVERTNEATISMANILRQPGVSVGSDMVGQRSGIFFPVNYPTIFMHSMIGPWLVGAAQVLQPVFDKRTFPQDLVDFKINYTVATPSHYAAIPTVDLPPKSLKNFRYAYCGGEAVSFGLAKSINDALERSGAPNPIIICYGMSELGPSVMMPAPGDRTIVNKVGQPLPGMKARIVDQAGNILGDGQRGFLEVYAPETRMKRYFNDPARTAEFFGDDGWGRTGDIAVRDEQGNYDVLGRGHKTLIDSNGETQYLFDIENSIYDHTAVLEAEVSKLVSPEGEFSVAHIVLRQEHRDRPEEVLRELRRICDEELSATAAPRGFRFHEAFPTNRISHKRDYIKLGQIRDGFLSVDDDGIYQVDFPEGSDSVVQYITKLS